MTVEEAPTCARHEAEVAMELHSIHTDASRPDELLGLFECPECGFQRRLPMQVDAA